MIKQQPVIIAGGGIAGLAVAIALARQGIAVKIFEQTAHFSEQGAGVQLGPNATAILRAWGLEPALLSVSCQPETIELHDAIKGQILTRLSVGRFVRESWHAPYVTIHRADLQKLLLAAIAASPLIELHCGAKVCQVSGSLEQGFDVTVMIQARQHVERAAVVVACDGVWSHLQTKKAEFSGSIAWRAKIGRDEGQSIAARFFDDGTVRVSIGKSGHFITYPISRGGCYNLVAITNSKEPDQGDKHNLVRTFAGWRQPIRQIIADIDDWSYWPIFVRKKPVFLNRSGVIFLGDSAHAMTPFAAQGAAMALEDGAALAKSLANFSQLSRHHLEDFARHRCKRVAQVARRGAFNKFVYHAGGVVAKARNIAMISRNPEKFLTDLDWLYGFRN